MGAPRPLRRQPLARRSRQPAEHVYPSRIGVGVAANSAYGLGGEAACAHRIHSGAAVEQEADGVAPLHIFPPDLSKDRCLQQDLG